MGSRRKKMTGDLIHSREDLGGLYDFDIQNVQPDRQYLPNYHTQLKAVTICIDWVF